MKISKPSSTTSLSSSINHVVAVLRLKHVVPLAIFMYGACMLVMDAMPKASHNLSSDDNHQESSSHSEPQLARRVTVVATSQKDWQEGDEDEQDDESAPTQYERVPTYRRRLWPGEVVSRVGPPTPRSKSGAAHSLWYNKHNVVHVINTRFWQSQTKLLHLAAARLDLFKTFTVPSLLQQTNNQFLWLIWTDETLLENNNESPLQALKDELVEILQEHVPNAVLLGAAQDKTSNFRALYGHSWTGLSTSVVTGNVQLLADYYSASTDHLVAETRLDADDALAFGFVESIQAQVAASMGGRARLNQAEWYCPESHVEWRYYSNNNDNDDSSTGQLIHYHNKEFCIWSGLTWAFNIESSDSDLAAALPSSSSSRMLQNNNGNNCPGGGNGCEVRSRQLEGLFEMVEVQEEDEQDEFSLVEKEQAETEDDEQAHRALTYYPPQRCETFNVGCYMCGGKMECFVSDHGRSRTSVAKVLWWLKQVGNRRSKAFCVQRSSRSAGQTCARQQCTKYHNYRHVSNVQAFALSQLAPAGTCPNVGIATCPSSGNPLTTFATYEVKYCPRDRSVGVEKCNGGKPKCTAGECTCSHGWQEFCSGCGVVGDDDDDDDNGGGGPCGRRLHLLPEQQQEEPTLYASAQVPPASVLLARTPTAAGMKNVLPGHKGGGENSLPLSTFADNNAKEAWQHVEREFGVSQAEVTQLRQRFQDDMEHILIDAFAGQCTPGHSCKESTKRALGQLLDQLQQQEQHHS